MTTVEELRDRSRRLRAELFFAIGRGDAALVATGSNIRIAADVDEILNAFLVQGRAEGAEQKRLEILKASRGTKPIDMTAGAIEHPTEKDTLYWNMAYIIPFSVLAPKGDHMMPTYRVTFCNKPGECKPPVLGWSESGILQGIRKATVDVPLLLIVRLEDVHAPNGYIDALIEPERVASVVEITP